VACGREEIVKTAGVAAHAVQTGDLESATPRIALAERMRSHERTACRSPFRGVPPPFADHARPRDQRRPRRRQQT
jgi:hypothetical protein